MGFDPAAAAYSTAGVYFTNKASGASSWTLPVALEATVIAYLDTVTLDLLPLKLPRNWAAATDPSRYDQCTHQ